MSVCKYCGERAGWFSDAHEDCKLRAAQGVESLKTEVGKAVMDGRKYEEIADKIHSIIADDHVPEQDARAALKQGWSDGAVSKALKQPVTPEEFEAIWRFYQQAGYTQDEVVKLPGHMQACFSWLLYQVLHGEIVPYDGPVQFNLQHGEIAVFGFGSIILYEERASSSYAGGYSGASIRVGRGLYYHFGGMQGHRVQTSSLQEVDYGQALITSQNFYFGGECTNFKIPFSQIIRFEPYEDGIGIAKNHGKKQLFVVHSHKDCGWFIYNVMQALANPQASFTVAQP